MIHSSYYKPRIYPWNSSGAPAEIDRLEELSGTTSLNRTRINEIGRDGTVGWQTSIPQVSLTLRQLEYGNLEFWNKITNNTATALTLNDFKTSKFDITGYKTDDDGTFLGTVWYPGQRVSGWSLNIGDPASLIERGFTFVGEDDIAFYSNNKYLIELESTATGAGHQIVIGSGGFSTYPDPVDDPDASGASQILRVLLVRSGTVTELVSGTDYTWNGTSNLMTFPYGTQNGDLFKVYYTASSYITGASPFTDNDADSAGLAAEVCSIYLQDSNYLYRLQSAAVDVSFDRQDLKEIGNSEIVQTGIRSKTVRITLGRILESYTIEEVLRGATTGYGKIDVRKYQDNLKLTIKIYDTKDKTNFLMGYSFTNLATTSQDAGVPTQDYVTKGTTLEGESATITSVEGSL